MKEKGLIILLICLISLFLTGCGSNNSSTTAKSSHEIKDDKTGIIISAKNSVDKSSLNISIDNTDYSDILNDADKYIAYDISLKMDTKEDVEVSLRIPDNYNRDKLIVYYIKDDKIINTYDVIVKDNYATFKTNHFSIYVLAELKDDQNKQKNDESADTKSKQVTTNNNTTKQSKSEVSSQTPKETQSCTPKKFNHKYTFVYNTLEECKNNGYNDIYVLWDAGEQYENVTTFGCEKIIDECGTVYYGEYFNIWVGPDVNNYEKLYY